MKTIAIVGQPNCGKSTIFNFLTGMSQTVGNWPGVTVEKKTGKMEISNENAEIIDLPGVYSLSPISNDEKVTRDFLLDNTPDLMINVVEGPTMERGLFLTLQLLMTGIPTIVVINMQDVLKKHFIEVDIERIKYLLGCKVIVVSGRTGMNLEYLKSEIKQFFSEDFVLRGKHIPIPHNDRFYSILNSLSSVLATTGKFGKMSSFYALKLLEGNEDIEQRAKSILENEYNTVLNNFQSHSKEHKSIEVIDWLYGIARGIYGDTVKEPSTQRISRTEALDFFLLNRIAALPAFLLTMLFLFFLTYYFGNMLSHMLGLGISAIVSLIPGNGFVSMLISDGIIGGVGNVLILLPYIFIMFLLIQFLEDSGYMARIAFIMDRFMHSLGLHGRSFIPLIMGFGCSVPAVMAARTLDTPQNRLKTILMIPFIPCSARLPVIVLISSAIFGRSAPFMIFFLYVISIITAIISGLIFSKTALKDKSEGMIMELPDYRLPQLKNLFMRAWSQSKEYLVKAGTIIFAISIILFVLSYFPTDVEGGFIHIAGKYIRPFFKPLGFDIPMTVSLITGFFAKESIISTLSVLYQTSAMPLSDYLTLHWNAGAGFIFMVFVMIYIPCIATVAVIRKETNSNKWTLISVVYSLLAAYAISMIFRVLLLLLHV